MGSRVLATAFLVLGCAAPAFAQAASKAVTEKALIANENKVSEAVAKHDLKTFNDLVAADGLSADMGGFMKVAEFTKTFDQVKISAWHIMDTKIMWIDDKSAIVTYTWMGKGTYMNQPLPETAYASTVWTERNGKWVAVFHQETGAAPSAPSKKK
jgi:hypothetical protein